MKAKSGWATHKSLILHRVADTPSKQPQWPQILETKVEDEVRHQYEHPHAEELDVCKCAAHTTHTMDYYNFGMVLYSSPPWRGFAGVRDWQKVYGYLHRSARDGFCSSDLSILASKPNKICLISFTRLINSCTPFLCPSVIPCKIIPLDHVHMIEHFLNNSHI